MTIEGQFKNIKNETVELIIRNSTGNQHIVIGYNGVLFTDEPITIDYEIDDSFTHIITTKATINLYTKEYLGDILFSEGVRDFEVTIFVNGYTMFYGYLDHNTYNQPYINGYNEFTLTAVDYLSTLQYYNYKGCTISNYNSLKSAADTVSFSSILQTILDDNNFSILYDRSKGIDNNRLANIFSDCSISEIMFYGEEFEDVWKQDEILNELLKYLNLHIIQQGYTIYIFDWNSIKQANRNWYNLKNGNISTDTISNINLTNGVFADSDTNITIDDVFSQLQLTSKLEIQKTLIENPLDKDNLISPYSGKQLYCTEFISEGSGDDANDAFNDMVDERSTTYDEAKVIDWYAQFMTNKNWKFYVDGNDTIENIDGIKDGNKFVNQWKIPHYLKHNQIVPSIIRLGSVEKKGGTITDNSPVSKIDMKDYLYISVNGNSNDYAANTASPTESTLRTQSPIMEYVSNVSGGIYSPVDDTTTNYLVFSGTLLLQPIQWESGESNVTRTNNYEVIKNNRARKTEDVDAKVPYYENQPSTVADTNIIKSEHNGEGRYYTRKFYTMVNPSDTTISYMNNGDTSLQPWSDDKGESGFEYNYSAIGDGSDQFSKIPILECELIIGNKRLIETDIDMYGNSTFQWVTIGQEPTATYVDEQGITQTYTVTTFSLGVNPKIGDKIIGTEYKIQNTISYQMNIDAEGTAIPITKDDKVSGKVQFKIVGLINSTWEQITRRHPSFWRHTKWTTQSRSILAHTENVIIKEFQCEIYSDNSLNDNTVNNKDLVYISNETDNYISKKDDLEFKFITQLSAEECREKGVSTSVNLNAVINNETELPLMGIYNNTTQETAKPEEHYINQYYLEYCNPKIVLETTVKDWCNTNPITIPFNSRFNSPVLGKYFYIMGMTKNLRLKTNTLKLKEYD